MDNPLIAEVANVLGDVKHLAKIHAPDVVKEILAWGVLRSKLQAAVSSLFFIAAGLVFRFGIEPGYSNDGAMVIILLLTIIGIAILLIAVFEFLQIKTAPKLYILEEAKWMVE